MADCVSAAIKKQRAMNLSVQLAFPVLFRILLGFKASKLPGDPWDPDPECHLISAQTRNGLSRSA